MSKIGIVGCGWLGTPVALQLLKGGHEIYGTTTTLNKKSILNNIGLLNISVGLFDLDWVGESISWLEEIDVLIINFPPSKRNSSNAHLEQIKSLVSKIHKNAKIIYTSSTSIYKEENKEVFEGEITNLESSASEKLYLAEEFLLNNFKERTTILRLGGLTGWNRNLAKFFAGKTQIKGGNMPVNLVHGEDAKRAILHVINTNCWGEIFNIVATKHPLKRDFYTALCEKNNMLLPDFENLENCEKFKIVNSYKFQLRTGFKYSYPNPYLFDYKI